MKKLISTLLCTLMLLSLSVSALALEPSDEFYVADYTSHLSRSVVDNIIDLNGQLENLCDNAQIVVVMTDYFGDVYADELAVSIFNDWEISSNGMLLVVSTEEFRGGLTVGEDIEPAFPDSLKNEYLDKYFWTDFDKRNYDTAVESLMIALAGWYSGKYDVSITYGGNAVEAASDDGAYFALAFFAVFFLLLIFAAVMSDRKQHRAYYRRMGVPRIPRYTPMLFFHGPHKTVYPTHHISTPGMRPRPGSAPSRNTSSRPSVSFRPSGGGFGGRSGGGFGGRR